MKDIQSLRDHRRINIRKVGVKTISYPITVLDREKRIQQTVATVNMYVNLPHRFKGTHMSRFVEILNQFHGRCNLRDFHRILQEMKERLTRAYMEHKKTIDERVRNAVLAHMSSLLMLVIGSATALGEAGLEKTASTLAVDMLLLFLDRDIYVKAVDIVRGLDYTVREVNVSPVVAVGRKTIFGMMPDKVKSLYSSIKTILTMYGLATFR